MQQPELLSSIIASNQIAGPLVQHGAPQGQVLSCSVYQVQRAPTHLHGSQHCRQGTLRLAAQGRVGGFAQQLDLAEHLWQGTSIWLCSWWEPVQGLRHQPEGCLGQQRSLQARHLRAPKPCLAVGLLACWVPRWCWPSQA